MSLTEILFQQQISHAVDWDQIRAFAVRHKRLTVIDMKRAPIN